MMSANPTTTATTTAPPLLILFLFLFLFSLSPSSSAATSAYEVLRAHGLPIGLLPKGVKEFNLDEAGRFEVHLDEACTAKFETEVHYDRNVSGTLSYGQIDSLSGVSVQELFLWFPVRGICVDIPSSGLIHFDVGVIYKQFSLSLFESPPDCSPVPSPDPKGEGSSIARLVSKSQSGKLRYDLDQADAATAAL